jgi:hypothetical protein
MKLFMGEVQLALHPACGDALFYTSPHAKLAALHTETSKTIVVDDTSRRVSSLDIDRPGVAVDSVTFYGEQYVSGLGHIAFFLPNVPFFTGWPFSSAQRRSQF